MMPKNVLILDGDSIAYKSSASVERRFINVTHEPSGKSKEFKHRTEFKKSMQEKNKEITEDYIIQDDREVQPLENVLYIVKKHIERICDEVEPDKLIIFAGEQNNFRRDLPLPTRYKGNRTDLIRPVHLEAAKTYLRTTYKAKESIGKENDDDCSIAAYEALKDGYRPVMYFYEKDQFQLDGVTLLYDKFDFEYQLVPELGELYLDKSSVKGLGLKFLAYQWICSDPVDCYQAYELSKVKFGAKSAYKVLNDCKSTQEVLLKVIEQFKIFYPETFEYTDWSGKQHEANWKYMLALYYKACRMMRSDEDALDCFELFDKYGVEIK